MEDDKAKGDLHDVDEFDILSSDPMDNFSKSGDDFTQIPPLVSTTRPLLTPPGDRDNSKTPSPSEEILKAPESISSFYGDNQTSSLIDLGIGYDQKPPSSSAVVAEPVGQHDAAPLSIDSDFTRQYRGDILREGTAYQASVHEKTEEKAFPEDPEIGSYLDSKPVPESEEKDTKFSAYDPIAHQGKEASPTPVKKATVPAAMEGDVSASSNKADGCCCPFSPEKSGSEVVCVIFSPEKLNPTVAEYIYWRDVKKSGIGFGLSLMMLLSLKYLSFISVIAYLMLAVLTVTVSFRIYKSILQAVQKSNEGHPFKDYLEMDITLSHDKLRDCSEALMGHVNAVAQKMRSLILVEDLFDTLKLFFVTWLMTYIGAWFNGMTVIILALVSAFTLPKVYETNKAQIDTYAEILRAKAKEIMDMINAKMPLGKKKKDE